MDKRQLAHYRTQRMITQITRSPAMKATGSTIASCTGESLSCEGRPVILVVLGVDEREADAVDERGADKVVEELVAEVLGLVRVVVAETGATDGEKSSFTVVDWLDGRFRYFYHFSLLES